MHGNQFSINCKFSASKRRLRVKVLFRQAKLTLLFSSTMISTVKREHLELLNKLALLPACRPQNLQDALRSLFKSNRSPSRSMGKWTQLKMHSIHCMQHCCDVASARQTAPPIFHLLPRARLKREDSWDLSWQRISTKMLAGFWVELQNWRHHGLLKMPTKHRLKSSLNQSEIFSFAHDCFSLPAGPTRKKSFKRLTGKMSLTKPRATLQTMRAGEATKSATERGINLSQSCLNSVPTHS